MRRAVAPTLAVTFIALAGAAGCSEASPVDVEPQPSSLMVDASADWAFVDLAATAAPITVAEPSSSGAWDIAFNATRVMLNGGAAGPGDVVGHCLCLNADATSAQIQAMTPESERMAFESVTAADVPTEEEAWESDALDAAIAGWYNYDMATHRVSAAPENVWKVRGAGEDPEFAAFHVTQIEGATRTGAQVTIEYAVQPGAGEAMGAVQTAVLDGLAGPVYFDFATGVSTAANWDIMLDGFDIRINGGVSGSGGAGAVKVSESLASVTDASDMNTHYRGDAFGGVFAEHAWYRYNLDGNHTIFPTYDVYLIKRGEDIYKVQLIGYYDTAGESRRITFRYALLDG